MYPKLFKRNVDYLSAKGCGRWIYQREFQGHSKVLQLCLPHTQSCFLSYVRQNHLQELGINATVIENYESLHPTSSENYEHQIVNIFRQIKIVLWSHFSKPQCGRLVACWEKPHLTFGPPTFSKYFSIPSAKHLD